MATIPEQRIGYAPERLAHLDRIESVVRGEALICGAEEVGDSWRRCASKHRVDPTALAPPNILTETQIRAFHEPLGNILEHAQEEIDRLYAIVRHEGSVVLLCNNDGIAIHHRGDEAKANEFKYWGIWAGGVWSEEIEGTNGIGTCVVEQRPISIHRAAHFRTRHTDLTCAGAPIFDVRGRLVAVLDTSAIASPTSDQSPGMTLAVTVVAARAIEERLFRNSYPQAWNIAAMSFDERGAAVLLAVDNDQRVVGADKAARSAFAIGDQSLIEGVPLSMLFEYDPLLFRRKKGEDIAARLMRTGSGGWWHVLITPPSSGSSGWRSRADAALHCLPRISRLGNLQIPEPTAPSRGGLPPRLTHRICEYIESHLEEKVTIVALAAMAGLSVHHFVRAFRQSVGLPPHSYLLQRRLEQVERMLRDTELPLSEIAVSAGFSDQSHLARHFRRLTGMSLGVARWKHR
jgi:AraC-like DNA-binding protein